MLLTPKRRLFTRVGSVNAASGTLHLATSPISPLSMTMACWVYATSTPAANWNLLSVDDGTHFSAFGATGASFHFGVQSDNNALGVDLGAIAAKTWYFIAMTGTAATLSGFVRQANTPFTTGGQSATSTTAGVAMWVNSDGLGDANWPGFIAGVKVWNFAMNASQLMLESQQLSPVRQRGLISYLPFKTPAGITADAALPGRTFTTTGSFTATTVTPPVPEVKVRKRIAAYITAASNAPKDPIFYGNAF